MNRRIIVCLAVLAAAALPALAGEWHAGTTNVCTDCHTMHFSMQHDWDSLNAPSNTPAANGNWLSVNGPNQFLLKAPANELCAGCHDGQTFAPGRHRKQHEPRQPHAGPLRRRSQRSSRRHPIPAVQGPHAGLDGSPAGLEPDGGRRPGGESVPDRNRRPRVHLLPPAARQRHGLAQPRPPRRGVPADLRHGHDEQHDHGRLAEPAVHDRRRDDGQSVPGQQRQRRDLQRHLRQRQRHLQQVEPGRPGRLHRNDLQPDGHVLLLLPWQLPRRPRRHQHRCHAQRLSMASSVTRLRSS